MTTTTDRIDPDRLKAMRLAIDEALASDQAVANAANAAGDAQERLASACDRQAKAHRLVAELLAPPLSRNGETDSRVGQPCSGCCECHAASQEENQ